MSTSIGSTIFTAVPKVSKLRARQMCLGYAAPPFSTICLLSVFIRVQGPASTCSCTLTRPVLRGSSVEFGHAHDPARNVIHPYHEERMTSFSFKSQPTQHCAEKRGLIPLHHRHILKRACNSSSCREDRKHTDGCASISVLHCDISNVPRRQRFSLQSLLILGIAGTVVSGLKMNW